MAKKNLPINKRIFTALALAALLPKAWSQRWPTKPIKIIVPSAAGSAPDTVTRLLGIELQKRLGQSVVADNKPGAGGALGADIVAKSPANDYTLVVGNIGDGQHW